MKQLGAVMLVAAFVLPSTAADRYKAGANAIACDDKPAMIEFVKALHTDQWDLAIPLRIAHGQRAQTALSSPRESSW